jgi:hypothetical protein
MPFFTQLIQCNAMKRYILIIFGIGVLAMLYIMMKTGEPLKTPETPIGILNLELAKDTIETNRILKIWSKTPILSTKPIIDSAKNNTYWDFLFIVFYAGFFAIGNSLLSEKMRGNFIKICDWASFAAVLAGLLDCLENWGILRCLEGHVSPTLSLSIWLFATIKFVLIGSSILVFIIIGSLRLSGFGRK